MQTISQLSERLVKYVKSEKDDRDSIYHVGSEVSWYLNDVFKVLKNINETSIGREDRAKRIIELEEKYGIPKTYII